MKTNQSSRRHQEYSITSRLFLPPQTRCNHPMISQYYVWQSGVLVFALGLSHPRSFDIERPCGSQMSDDMLFLELVIGPSLLPRQNLVPAAEMPSVTPEI